MATSKTRCAAPRRSDLGAVNSRLSRFGVGVKSAVFFLGGAVEVESKTAACKKAKHAPEKHVDVHAECRCIWRARRERRDIEQSTRG